MAGGGAARIAVVGAPAERAEEDDGQGHQADGRHDGEYASEHDTSNLTITLGHMTST
ncbi:hypothetical protein Mam01_13720 [Microbispora amethystogenes]|uniref:Uncharacterized protein n=1 Tax=Microbispora amethystogenes TaxID=1427754 RepID=A0ABQ4F8V7_9ACTN|nr:hypothetical protein Mam01_13720 [Microbispora amethystogenes]